MFTIENLNPKVMQNLKFNAIRSLVGESGGFSISGEGVVSFEEDTTSVTDAEIAAEMARLQDLWDNADYSRNRAEAYPSIEDQLDMIFHAGLGGDEFQAAIQAVKDAYPKP